MRHLEDILRDAGFDADPVLHGGRWYVTKDAALAGMTAVIEDCAKVAENACLVPPDGGSCSAQETEVAAEAARRIRALKS